MVWEKKELIWGVSFGSAIVDIANLGEVLSFPIDLIEMPATYKQKLKSIYNFAKANSLITSLHIPSPELVNEFPFIIDTRTECEVVKYLREIDNYFYLPYDYEYVVIHFPLITKMENKEQAAKLNSLFLDGICDIAKKHGIKVYLENIAVSRFFCTAEDYKSVLSKVSGYCFDIGHAYTMEGFGNQLIRNFDINSNSIQCIHLYNTVKKTDEKYRKGIHYPFHIDNEYEGFMDVDNIISHIKKLKNLQYIIFEPHREQYKQCGFLGYKFSLEM